MAQFIPGVILKCFPYGESDLIIRFVAQGYGKLSALARGAKKSKRRFVGGLDIFDIGVLGISYSKGSLLTLTSFEQKGGFKALRSDFDKFIISTSICESFDSLLIDNGHHLEELPNHRGIYEGLEAALQGVEKSQSVKESLGVAFDGIAKLLELNGLLDPGELGQQIPRSAKGLNLLLDRIEATTHKGLVGRQELAKLLSGPIS